MRKREIEKLLFDAVAEALGVETKAPRQKIAARRPVPASLRKARQDHHRAAA